MKLTAIRLRNVKKFGANGVAIDGISSGLSILSAPNEFGKSTIFDAVRILLLQKHNARNKETKSLAPLSNSGAPEVEIEVEVDAKRYRIWKRFLSVPKAQVTDLGTGDVIAQDGTADDWILTLIGANSDKYGPVGLLWVAQGASMDQPEGGGSLLSSLLEAEVGTLVGGDRARTYLQRCRDDLGGLVTSTGKPKTGGAYKTAVDELEANGSKLDQLKDRARAAEQLSTDLVTTEQKLKTLTNPEETLRREEALKQAEVVFQAANRSAGELEVLESRVAAKQREVDDAAQKLKVRDALEAAVMAAETECAKVQSEADQFVERHDSMSSQIETSRCAAGAAKTAFDDARKAKKVADRFHVAQTAWKERERLNERLGRAREIKTGLAKINTDLTANKVTDEVQNQLSDLSREFDRCYARLDAARPLLRAVLTELGKSTITIDGHPLDATEVRIAGTTEIGLGALGKIEIDAQDPAAALQAFQEAELKFKHALENADCETFDDVGPMAAARRQLEQDRFNLNRELADIASEGVERLALHLAELQTQIPDGFDPGATPPSAPSNIELLEQAKDEKVAESTALERDHAAVREKLAELNADLGHASRQLESALQSAGPKETWTALRSDLKNEVDRLRSLFVEAQAELTAKREAAPDLTNAKLTRDRLLQAKENAVEQISTTRAEQGRILGELRGQEAEGIGEQVAQAEATHKVCERRVAKIEQNIEALSLLEATLETCQSRLQEEYFKPVQVELQPLLQIVLGKNDIVLSEAYQAEKLRRGEYNETVDMLSGGTREQIAVLTRLAFGKLMARQKKPAPVFLDDALVYCDDERLGAMFNALHAAAADVQCIILTCHERAFGEIGGTQLTPANWPIEHAN